MKCMIVFALIAAAYAAPQYINEEPLVAAQKNLHAAANPFTYLNNYPVLAAAPAPVLAPVHSAVIPPVVAARTLAYSPNHGYVY